MEGPVVRATRGSIFGQFCDLMDKRESNRHRAGHVNSADTRWGLPFR